MNHAHCKTNKFFFFLIYSDKTQYTRGEYNCFIRLCVLHDVGWNSSGRLDRCMFKSDAH